MLTLLAEIDPEELPPLDEHGVPKYRGKKRGRKPRIRKRKAGSTKRQPTGYTLFVQEHYSDIKIQNPDRPSKDLISIVAKQWEAAPDSAKETWRAQARALNASGDEDADEENEEFRNEQNPGIAAEEDGDDDEESPHKRLRSFA